MTPRVSAICVSYNCADLLRTALASLRAQDVPGGLEVIVVDNASLDDGVAAASSFGGVEVITLERNVGFGAANNIGARRARGEYLLFVNPDVEVPLGVVAALSSFLSSRPAAAAAGPTLVGRDGAVQRYCARKFPRLAHLLLQVAGVGESRWAGAAWAHNFYPPSFYGRGPARVAALSGAFLMTTRGAFNAAGGFDERYFLYWEDVDLCRRIARQGEIWYIPTAPVCHFTGGSRRSPNPAVVVATHTSTARYARLWHGGAAARVVQAASRSSLLARRLVCGVLGIAWPAARRRAGFYRDTLALRRRLTVKNS